jgi:hypothetical protein
MSRCGSPNEEYLEWMRRRISKCWPSSSANMALLDLYLCNYVNHVVFCVIMSNMNFLKRVSNQQAACSPPSSIICCAATLVNYIYAIKNYTII